MMKLVLLDLHGDDAAIYQRMQTIEARLKLVDGGWWRQSENCWLIVDSKTSNYWASWLRELMQQQDTVFVSDVRLSNVNGWLPRNVWEWLRANDLG